MSFKFKLSLLLLALVGCSALFAFEWIKVTTVTQAIVLDKLPVLDCGVVLTGSPGRIRESFEVMAQKKIKKLIVSGVHKDVQLREIFPQIIFYPEISSQDIILEKRSESTYGNAVQSLSFVKSFNCRSILLITSQLHMYRALRIFKALYPAEIIITAYPVVNPNKESSSIDIAFESIKSLFYTGFGRVL